MVDRLSIFVQQDGNQLFSNGGLWSNDSVDPSILFGILGAILVSLALGTFLVYRYQRWRRFKAFEDELQQLGLDPNQEGTFGDLVKRYKMNDPVEILFSLRMFDEIAAREMDRILGSPGSKSAKEEFIDTLYEIREKTYLRSEEGEIDPDAKVKKPAMPTSPAQEA